MTWVSTRALVEGKEPGYGAGCGGSGDFPLRRGVMSILKSRKLPHSPTAHVLLEYISELKFTISFSYFPFPFLDIILA